MLPTLSLPSSVRAGLLSLPEFVYISLSLLGDSRHDSQANALYRTWLCALAQQEVSPQNRPRLRPVLEASPSLPLNKPPENPCKLFSDRFFEFVGGLHARFPDLNYSSTVREPSPSLDILVASSNGVRYTRRDGERFSAEGEFSYAKKDKATYNVTGRLDSFVHMSGRKEFPSAGQKQTMEHTFRCSLKGRPFFCHQQDFRAFHEESAVLSVSTEACYEDTGNLTAVSLDICFLFPVGGQKWYNAGVIYTKDTPNTLVQESRVLTNENGFPTAIPSDVLKMGKELFPPSAGILGLIGSFFVPLRLEGRTYDFYFRREMDYAALANDLFSVERVCRP